jgi:tetratricopeptide (TPR) repeat protein
MIFRFTRPTLCVVLLLIVTALGANGCAWFARQRYEPMRAKADRAFEQRDYELAATRYENLSDAYPSSVQREGLLFQLGMAYYLAGSRHEAATAFERYLTEYPGGSSAEMARDYREKIAMLQTEAPVRAEALEQARDDERQLRSLLESHPHSGDVSAALGNLLYSLGRYEEATAFYDRAMKVGAARQELALIEQRMMLDEEGRAAPVTPEALEALDRERRPLAIYNLREFEGRNRGGGGYGGGGDVVSRQISGMVRNQGSRMLRGVEIEVTFLNAANQVQDVARRRIGALAPGSVRAFRVEAVNYDSRFNIVDYDVAASWEEGP